MPYIRLLNRCRQPSVWLMVFIGIVTITVPSIASAGIVPGRTTIAVPAVLTPMPTPSLRVSLPPHAEDARIYWDHRNDTYKPGYVYSQMSVAADACDSSGGGGLRVVSFVFRAIRLDGPASPVTAHTSNCRTSLNLPARGQWRITVTVTNSAGGSASTEREVRDLVVLALGDSITSGEGNPDTDKHGSRAADWMDLQCDRSMASWAALAAKRLENASTSVTFLDFACSGASAWQVGLGTYRGEHADAGRPLRGQVLAAEHTLGPLTDTATRPVDIMLMSAGINDVHATDLLERCANLLSIHNDIFHDCLKSDTARNVLVGLHELPATFAFLGDMLPFHLKISNASVHVVAYPEVHLFPEDRPAHHARRVRRGSPRRSRAGGCDALREVTPHEAAWFTEHAKELNDIVRKGARRNGWTNLHGFVEKFRNHDYCANDTWFRSYSGSKKLQGNENGTAHPTRQGHQVIAATVISQIHPGPPPPPAERLVVQLQRVCIAKQRGVLPDALYFALSGWRPIIHLDSKQLRTGRCVTLPHTTGTLHIATAGERIKVQGVLVRERSSCSLSCRKPKLPRSSNKILPGQEQPTEPNDQSQLAHNLNYLPSLTFEHSFARSENWGVAKTSDCTPGNPTGCIHPPIPIGVQYGPVRHVRKGALQVDYRIGIDHGQPTLRR
jgi:hypothetical protein